MLGLLTVLPLMESAVLGHRSCFFLDHSQVVFLGVLPTYVLFVTLGSVAVHMEVHLEFRCFFQPFVANVVEVARFERLFYGYPEVGVQLEHTVEEPQQSWVVVACEVGECYSLAVFLTVQVQKVLAQEL